MNNIATRTGRGMLMALAGSLIAGCAGAPSTPPGLRPANAEVIFVTRGSLEGTLDASG